VDAVEFFHGRKISVLHVFGLVAKRARAAIHRNEFQGAQEFRNLAPNFLRLKNIYVPELHFP
jgi:hypothetical protein